MAFRKQTPAREGFPPTPKGPAILGTLRWVFAPYPFLDKHGKEDGSPFHITLPNKADGSSFKPVFFSSPDDLKKIFLAPADVLDAAGSNSVLEPFLGKFSLLLLREDAHLRHRRLLLPPLHVRRMRAYGSLIQDITKSVVEKWSGGEVISTLKSMQEISLEVIFGAIFGLSENPLAARLKVVVVSFLEKMTGSMIFFPAMQKDLGPWSPGGRLIKVEEEMRDLLKQWVEERRKQSVDGESSGDDILGLLLDARNEEDAPLSPQELSDELVTLLMAGHETTASALSWGLHWVHANPSVEWKLRQELEALGPNPSPEALSKAPYLEAVCKETLRLKPILPLVARRVDKPFSVRGYDFEPGDYLCPCIYLAHRNPKVFSSPGEFIPERFIDKKYSIYEYLPFGGGTRRCIGMGFAMYEMKVVLGTILGTKTLQLHGKKNIREQRRNVTVAPAGGGRFLVKS